MSERMITIPYKEYQELQTYKKIANSDDERVYIKEEAEASGNFYSWWFVYTKDQAVRDLSDKLNKAREELRQMKESQDTPKKQTSKRELIKALLVICIGATLAYVVSNIHYI